MKAYFEKMLELISTRPGYAHTDHFYRVKDDLAFDKGWCKGFFSKQDLIDYADNYFYNFGGEVRMSASNGKLQLVVTVYTD